jgi:predicted transcriptional regulator
MYTNSSQKIYRHRYEIVKDILQVAEESGSIGCRKTHIMYRSNLSYKLLTKYLREVVITGLLFGKKSRFVITSKGVEYLRFYESYDAKRKEIEEGINHLNNRRITLEKMLDH